MIEAFTTTLNSTTNRFEMKEQDSIENMGTEETSFYNSIRNDLDLMERSPNVITIQNILHHSENYQG